MLLWTPDAKELCLIKSADLTSKIVKNKNKFEKVQLEKPWKQEIKCKG